MFLWSSTLWSHMLWTLLLLNPLWNWKGLLLQGIFGEEGLFHPQACNNMTFMVPAWENFYMLLHSLFPSQHARSCKLSWMTRIWLISWAKVHHVAAAVWAWPSAFIYVIFLVFAHCYIEQTQPIDFLVEFFHLSMNPVLDSWKKKTLYYTIFGEGACLFCKVSWEPEKRKVLVFWMMYWMSVWDWLLCLD